jgi:hypothetical protein
MGERYEAEKQKRQSRDAELRAAEDTIEQLQLHLNQLEDIMDGKSKRVLPARTQEDSPELHAAKKTHTEAETLTLGQGILNQGILNQNGNLLDAPSSAKDAAPRSESSRSTSTSSSSARSSSKDPSSDSTSFNKTRTHTVRPTEEERDNNGPPAEFRGSNRRIPLAPSEVKHRPDGCYTDEEIGILSLEAWRTRCRKLHDYVPDRHWDLEVHLDKVKFLQAALSNFKRDPDARQLSGRGLVEWAHSRYESLQHNYHIPRNTCSPRDFAKNIEDGKFSYQKRCVPVHRYYSMLIRDTPGYVPEKPRPPRRDIIPAATRKDVIPALHARQTESSRTRVNPRSFEHRADGKFHSRSNIIPSSILNRGPSHEPLVAHESSSAIPGTVYTGGPTERSAPRPSSQYDDVYEDFQNPQYDHRLSNGDKRKIDDLERDIKLIRQRTASKNYVEARDTALNRAETARQSGKETPGWLRDARPPWNVGTGLAITRYDEMMIEDIKQQILNIRSDNATIRVLEDADKTKGGPGGQARR